MILNDTTIDFELNARPGRVIHDRAEFAKSRSVVLRTQTVSMDTISFFRITDLPFQMAWCASFASPPRQTLPSPPPP